MLIPTGLHVWKLDVLLVARVFGLRAAPLRTRCNFNLLLQDLPQKRNTCLLTSLVQWFCLCEVHYGTLEYHRRRQLSYTRTTMHVQLWQILKNPRHIDIKYFSLSKWVEHDLMLLERIDKVYSQLSFIVTQTSYWVTFLQHTCQCTILLLDCMPGMMTIWINLFSPLSRPLSQQLQLECMLLYGLIIQTIPGFQFLGMGFTIHMFPCLVV